MTPGKIHISVKRLSNLCQPMLSLGNTEAEFSLSSSDIMKSPCSAMIRNIELRAKPGQQINISLTDFMWQSDNSHRGCVSYGEVTDKQTQRHVRLCGGQHRESTVMVSISSTVKLNLQPVSANNRYLLTFAGRNN